MGEDRNCDDFDNLEGSLGHLRYRRDRFEHDGQRRKPDKGKNRLVEQPARAAPILRAVHNLMRTALGPAIHQPMDLRGNATPCLPANLIAVNTRPAKMTIESPSRAAATRWLKSSTRAPGRPSRSRPVNTKSAPPAHPPAPQPRPAVDKTPGRGAGSRLRPPPASSDSAGESAKAEFRAAPPPVAAALSALRPPPGVAGSAPAPDAIAPTVAMLHGTIAMPRVGKDPLAIGAATSCGRCSVTRPRFDQRATASAKRSSVSWCHISAP